MKVIVAGSRGYNDDYDTFRALMDDVSLFLHPKTIISGMAAGPDTLALQWAAEKDLPVEKFPADWKTYGKAAGPIRNEQMAEAGDALVCFWDGKSRGSKSMIDLALAKQLVVIVIPVVVEDTE